MMCLWLLTILFPVVSFAADVSPPEVLASMRVGAWGGCSGITVAVDDKAGFALTNAHCCQKVGDKVGLCFVDGRIVNGIFIAEDETVDLALIWFPIEYVLAVTPLHERPRQAGEWIGVGYPASSGPNVKQLKYTRVGQNDRGMSRWVFAVKSGLFWSGDSGGGIVQDHRLAAITSDGHNGGPDVGWAYACPQPEIAKFLDTHLPEPAKQRTREVCKDGGGYCPVTPNPQQDTKTWKPSPNVEIKLPERTHKPGDGWQNDSTLTDRKATELIAALIGRCEKLEQRVAALEGPNGLLGPGRDALPPPPVLQPTDKEISAAVTKWLEANQAKIQGIDGRDGKDGTNGKAGEPGVVTINLQWSGGAPIKRLPDLKSGSEVDVKLKKEISEPK
jgi:hypothetical protein